MNNNIIAVLGAGNIGLSIAEGLSKSSNDKIIITRRKIDNISVLKNKNLIPEKNNKKAVLAASIVIIAVQPMQTKKLLNEIKDCIDIKKHIIISVVTGFGFNELQSVLGKEVAIFRAMPNIAISIQESMTCISSINASKKQVNLILSIFDKLGKSIIIDDELMNSATVLAACGVAFSLRFIRAASQGGIEIGFDANIAQQIAAQTIKGAASLLLADGLHPEKEIDKVTTPKGCTIAGLNEMEHNGFSSALIKGLKTSYNRISEIVEE